MNLDDFAGVALPARLRFTFFRPRQNGFIVVQRVE
jgi:hypothetical protein